MLALKLRMFKVPNWHLKRSTMVAWLEVMERKVSRNPSERRRIAHVDGLLESVNLKAPIWRIKRSFVVICTAG
jgi:hypothetical protein